MSEAAGCSPFVLLCIRGAICLISLEFNLADCDGKAPANLAFSQITVTKRSPPPPRNTSASADHGRDQVSANRSTVWQSHPLAHQVQGCTGLGGRCVQVQVQAVIVDTSSILTGGSGSSPVGLPLGPALCGVEKRDFRLCVSAQRLQPRGTWRRKYTYVLRDGVRSSKEEKASKAAQQQTADRNRRGEPGVAELLTKTEHFPSQTSDITKASDARLKPHNCLGFLYYSLFYC
ncbi:uncharacterized protein LOC119009123 [Acanthopagrus latus]|uniref:uncharacterized protein LOC119009123 n=1 Tax=Acanthopagrus latus TaxID=8177 RepID=UPI00187CEBF3|nr:uncharacterized protein LOC119009123 [Acanthopagrus latus]